MATAKSNSKSKAQSSAKKAPAKKAPTASKKK